MRLSDVFSWPSRSRDKQETQRQTTSEKKVSKKDAVSSGPPETPPVTVASKDTRVGAAPPKKELAPKAPETPGLAMSQRVWNRAYDELAEDVETAPLVQAYVKLLPRATNLDDDSTEPDDEHTNKFQAQMKSPGERQAVMKSTVEAGQAKIAKSSKITNGVGNVADFILRFKDVVNTAVKGNPQAALPWAGVCIGLQVRLSCSNC